MLDTHMPGMSGLEVCAAMKRDPALAQVPIIMATAHETSEVELAAVERGVADFVSKPLSKEIFRARVKARLRDRAGRPGDTVVAQSRLDRPTLMIVDDDVAAVQMLGATLQDLGVVHFVTKGAEAVARARELAPDLVLLDSHMPDVDGFQVCRELQADEKLKHVPIVFVTRFDDTPAETLALDLGAADFISKPFSSAVLRARVRNLLELKLRTDAQLREHGERWRQLADERLAEVVRTASDAILCCDALGRILLANAAAGRLFGVQVEQLVGHSLSGFVPLAAEVAERAARVPLRLSLGRADGTVAAAEVTASRSEAGGSPLVTLVLRDVADRERLEAETRARIAAEASSQGKTRMIGVIAHEMGNPLNALLGFAELLKLDASDALGPRQKAWVQQMDDAASTLRTLLDDLLDFARNESGATQVRLGEVELGACIDDVVQRFARVAERAGVQLKVQPPEVGVNVCADARRLGQCLGNLVSNAIKYNRPGGTVRLAVVPMARRACIEVRDDGLGLDENQLAALFEPFNRLGRERSSTPGTGLGLVITRQYVNAMGGELQVESQAGVGSCFKVLMPYA
ncbi:response regulator [Piscinibacter aquaticus]|uniref:histidine kinase n=1 Tax=Piscinibacter aquaticus TaxID=392597 RepID=A0A5C6U0Z5_9BURK|nr:response regulator [Piscinibacter aquaticus]